MTTQQTEEGATRAWEDSLMSCIQAQTDHWCPDAYWDGRTVHYAVQLVRWDDPTPFPASLPRIMCSSYETALARATVMNRYRARGGRDA